MYTPFVFNKEHEVRDAMLKFDTNGWMGGTRHYTGMTYETLGKMIDMKFADPEECQNASPSIGEIYEWLRDRPHFTAFGYVVSIDRDDYRLSIEGVAGDSKSMGDIVAFTHMFRFADDFQVEVGHQYAWYD